MVFPEIDYSFISNFVKSLLVADISGNESTDDQSQDMNIECILQNMKMFVFPEGNLSKYMKNCFGVSANFKAKEELKKANIFDGFGGFSSIYDENRRGRTSHEAFNKNTHILYDKKCFNFIDEKSINHNKNFENSFLENVV